MSNYKYLEFTDRTGHGRRIERSGKLFLVGEATEEIISEFNMKDAFAGKTGKSQYYATWNSISGTGWELFSVTPCAYSTETGNYVHSGTIEHSYIFRKEM